MTVLLHKPYLVKVTRRGESGLKIPKILATWFMNDPQSCVSNASYKDNMMVAN